MRTVYAAMILLCLGAAACEKPCAVPAGKYEITYKVLEGDCPAEVVTAFDGKKSEIDLEAGECRRFAFQHNSKLPNGCALDTDMSAELTAGGATDGQAAVTLRCTEPKAYVCRHLFTVDYQRKP